MTKDCDIVLSRIIFFRPECAPQQRFHAQKRKETGGYDGALNPFRFTSACQVEAGVIEGGNLFKAGGLIPLVAELGG